MPSPSQCQSATAEGEWTSKGLSLGLADHARALKKWPCLLYGYTPRLTLQLGVGCGAKQDTSSSRGNSTVPTPKNIQVHDETQL
ncbi:hypothetical protein VTO73DRAFT_4566 [Trametes versicolor]